MANVEIVNFESLESLPLTSARAQLMLLIGNNHLSSKLTTSILFVDLPNGNKGMVMCKVLDFNIPTGNSSPEQISESSYEVDLPELELAMSEAEL
jgi:hypothetical protein